MDKHAVIVVLVVIILALGGYFVFVKQSLITTTNPTLNTTALPTTDQSKQTNSVIFTDPPSFAPSFLQCTPSELRMPFPGDNIYVNTVYGVENDKCHYILKVVNKDNVALQGIDCLVPKELISTDILNHVFGGDKVPGQEKILAEQNKIEADYCKK